MPDTDISVFPYSVSSKHLAVMNSSVPQRCQRYPVWDKGSKWGTGILWKRAAAALGT